MWRFLVEMLGVELVVEMVLVVVFYLEVHVAAIVGTYSNKCKRKNAFLCYLEELGNILDDTATTTGARHVEYNEPYVRPFCDEPSIKVNVIKSDLGTGKTFQTKQHFAKWAPKSALIVTPRIIFGQCLLKQLRASCPAWSMYSELNDMGKRIYTEPYLVCQINSIWRICPDVPYDHVYIDEIESCLNMLSADITTKTRRDCCERLECS